MNSLSPWIQVTVKAISEFHWMLRTLLRDTLGQDFRRKVVNIWACMLHMRLSDKLKNSQIVFWNRDVTKSQNWNGDNPIKEN